MSGPGSFTVTPNPAPEGTPIEVQGEPGDVVYWQPEGSTDWHRVELDADGKGSFTPPSGVPGVTVSDRVLPSSNTVFVEIESTAP